jgi:DNA-binding transcriptional ArsR family regulator
METLELIGSPSRWKILEALKTGDKTVGELSESLHMSNQGVLKHLAVLMKAGMVKPAKPKKGRKVAYSLERSLFMYRSEAPARGLYVFYHKEGRPKELEPEVEFRVGRLLRRLRLLLDNYC